MQSPNPSGALPLPHIIPHPPHLPLTNQPTPIPSISPSPSLSPPLIIHPNHHIRRLGKLLLRLLVLLIHIHPRRRRLGARARRFGRRAGFRPSGLWVVRVRGGLGGRVGVVFFCYVSCVGCGGEWEWEGFWKGRRGGGEEG